ncbi:MAG: BREX-2 system adenine-specific DNA-methyltransferase PglX, partial [Fimbriimonadaceae bacterium]|nr:BREX-2 system adenine-specific DNA-methyltransferase PglX [Fimbriimonadaceae bacterium]
LAVPFKERCFDLVRRQDEGSREPAGFVGMITANSFMKREFGKKLIEAYFPRWDLTHVVDTSGAYVPGHGTPTVILFARGRRPRDFEPTVRAVRGIRGEPSTPDDPARGQVWTAILQQVDRPGSESEFVSVDNTQRATFHKHPWSLGGGGAAELKERLEANCKRRLGDLASEIGITSVTGEDDLYVFPDPASCRRLDIEVTRPLVTGDRIRDWTMAACDQAIWLYDEQFRLLPLNRSPKAARLLWKCKASISKRKRFGTPMLEKGLTWYEWQELYADKLRTPLSIAFAFVATHNHFVLDRGGKVFNRTAPVIKLRSDATEDDHLALLGVLNSSSACFWIQQQCHNKGGPGGASSKDEKWHDFYEHDGTKLKSLPLPQDRTSQISAAIDSTAQRLNALEREPQFMLSDSNPPERTRLQHQLIALQEELDWQSYGQYGLVEDPPLWSSNEPVPPVRLGERAFEIALARAVAAGEVHTKWFQRHESTPVTEIPEHWPKAYRDLIQHRLHVILSDRDVRLIEQPAYKRRWQFEPWDQIRERT